MSYVPFCLYPFRKNGTFLVQFLNFYRTFAGVNLII